jgi:hypothetical protein
MPGPCFMTPLGSSNRGCAYPSKERLSYLIESLRVHARWNASFPFQLGLAQELGVMTARIKFKYTYLVVLD